MTSVADATRQSENAELIDLLSDTASIPGGESASKVGDVQITVPSSLAEPVSIGEGAEAVHIYRPGHTDEPAASLQDGVSAHALPDGSDVVTAVKADSTVQIATVLQDAEAPERYAYPISIPEGARLELINGQPFVWAADGSMIGGFFPAWAVDAAGQSVPTHYELEEGILTQVVEHRSAAGVEYPVVADPAYRRGMIDQVK